MKEENEESIFRKSAVEEMGNPEQFDQLLTIVTPKIWITLFCLIVVVLLIAIWSFFGSIPVKIQGSGIVINKEGLYSIQSKTKGTIRNIKVDSGDIVEKNQLVIEIFDPQQELKLQSSLIQLQNLSDNVARLKKQIEIEEKAQKEAIKRQLAAEEFSSKLRQKEIQSLEEDVKTKEQLHEEGLISIQAVDQAEKELIQKKIELETIKSNIVQLYANLSKSYRTEEFRSRERALLEVQETKDLVEAELKFSKVYNPELGRVLEVLVNEGELVQPGLDLLWMEYYFPGKRDHLIYGYFPVEKGKKLKVGDNVEIELSTVNSQEFGFMLGKIKEVSQFAVSPENIAKSIHNKQIINYLTGGGQAVIQVIIEPVKDPNTPSGYKWTSGEGPPMIITSGTMCQLKTIIERIRPIYYVFPIWKLRNPEEILGL